MLSEYDKQWCTKLLADLLKMPITLPFRVPVDPVREAPNYLDIVKNPMDLSTMKKKLQGNEYDDVNSFIADIKLICDNAKTFNGENSMFGFICNDIMDEVNRQFCEKSDNADEEWFKSMNKAVMKLQEHMANAPPAVAEIQNKTPLPDIENLDLSDDQIVKIEQLIGGDMIRNLTKRWMNLNDITRESIIKIIETKDDENSE